MGTQGMSFPYVVRGARISCTWGSHSSRLDMPACHGAYIREKPMMHEKDCRVGIEANIAPFGACFSPQNPNPEVIIYEAANLMPVYKGDGASALPALPVIGKLCQPMLGNKWLDAHEDTLVDGVAALRTNCTLACLYQGVIHFIDDGQEVG